MYVVLYGICSFVLAPKLKFGKKVCHLAVLTMNDEVRGGRHGLADAVGHFASVRPLVGGENGRDD
jgi:hypothetical protein